MDIQLVTRKVLQQHLTANNMSNSRLSRELGLSRTTVMLFLRGERDLGINGLNKIWEHTTGKTIGEHLNNVAS